MTRWPPLATLGFALGASALLWALIIVTNPNGAKQSISGNINISTGAACNGPSLPSNC